MQTNTINKDIDNDILIDVENLSIGFEVSKRMLKAVENVSFKIKKGEILGICGESGSGKSVTVTSIMKLLPPNGKILNGSIIYKGQDLSKKTEKEMRSIRGNEISMVFQDPMTSLNPVFTVQNQLVEAIRLHQDLSKKQAIEKAIELLKMVGIKDAEKKIKLYPHEFSGGMRQRVMIAMAIASNPNLIIADEPTTALDVTVQKQILDLLSNLRKEINTSIVLITHDLDVVKNICDRVCVMYAGEIVEEADVVEIFKNPLHPYTKMLINSVPSGSKHDGLLNVIDGTVPALENIDRTKCVIADRIKSLKPEDHEENPQLREVAPNHFVRCTCYKHFSMEEERKFKNDFK
jgi:oligopeptide/dipeptide ABC transporter ATP-binding protein